jgi:gliding motility-associated-like protein
MKQLILIIFLLLAVHHCRSQNLIFNGSLEQFNRCPGQSGGEEIEYADGWFNPTRSTPDYYNMCDTTGVMSFPFPHGLLSYQYPHEGRAAAGCVFAYGVQFNGREYVAGTLTQPLKLGHRYTFWYYVSNISRSQPVWQNPTFDSYNKMGFALSTTQVILTSFNTNTWDLRLPLKPIYESPHQFYDTTATWDTVCHTFVADSAYKYFYIGVFCPNDSVTFIPHPANDSYYLIDDVHLIEVKDTLITPYNPSDSLAPPDAIMPNAFSPNADGLNDVVALLPPVPITSNFNIQIYNRWGNRVFESNNAQFKWDGSSLGIPQPSGVFVYTIKYTNTLQQQKAYKGNITLVR